MKWKVYHLRKCSSSAKDIGVKTYEASHNTYLDMQEFLGIEKALKTIQVEQGNNKSRLIRKERY